MKRFGIKNEKEVGNIELITKYQLESICIQERQQTVIPPLALSAYHSVTLHGLLVSMTK